MPAIRTRRGRATSSSRAHSHPRCPSSRPARASSASWASRRLGPALGSLPRAPRSTVGMTPTRRRSRSVGRTSFGTGSRSRAPSPSARRCRSTSSMPQGTAATRTSGRSRAASFRSSGRLARNASCLSSISAWPRCTSLAPSRSGTRPLLGGCRPPQQTSRQKTCSGASWRTWTTRSGASGSRSFLGCARARGWCRRPWAGRRRSSASR
mmetsp:Transcript_35909/g.103303  ORF Transcript_35909/g.103303 Transcript_35909/m.103303 type:complete len:209 (+) Transcript_35909:794-1420(+)